MKIGGNSVLKTVFLKKDPCFREKNKKNLQKPICKADSVCYNARNKAIYAEH
jgi:hypothetical protein